MQTNRKMELYEARNLYNEKAEQLFDKYENNKRKFVSELNTFKLDIGLNILYQESTKEGIVVVANFKGEIVQQLLGIDENYKFFFIKNLDLD